jgi:methionyl-tRNA synthetase
MLVSLGFGYYPWKGLRMASKPTVSFDDFAKLDLRVGTIKAVEPHPNADKLLKMQVDLGDEQRQICAGIKPYTEDPQALVGQQIVVVANLEPRKIRGEESNGMLLAASVTEGDALQDVVVLGPKRETPAGASVS